MSRLGRNPFEKKTEKKAEKPSFQEDSVEVELPPRLAVKKPQTFSERLAQLLHVDLPAEGFILGLKAALLLRSVWD
jgi:hypothetical protein